MVMKILIKVCISHLEEHIQNGHKARLVEVVRYQKEFTHREDNKFNKWNNNDCAAARIKHTYILFMQMINHV